mmetsp:Transcript_10385/g.23766  ORF Transcript_10385/g.23766 Transcript_10385/m.23766 type:complete len:200 (-) Transcript_10385:390-989(-)
MQPRRDGSRWCRRCRRRRCRRRRLLRTQLCELLGPLQQERIGHTRLLRRLAERHLKLGQGLERRAGDGRGQCVNRRRCHRCHRRHVCRVCCHRCVALCLCRQVEAVCHRADRPIVRPGQDVDPVPRVRHRVHRARVPFKGIHLLPRRRIPQTHALVVRPTDEVRATAEDVHRPHRFRVPLEDPLHRPADHVPRPQRPIP